MEQKPAEKPQQSQPPEEPNAEGTPQTAPVEFCEKDRVKTKASKQKDKFNDQEGRVVQVLRNDCKVELLTGPARLEMKNSQRHP